MWPFKWEDDFPFANNSFGAVRLVKNADKGKYKYYGCGIGFNNHGTFSLSGDVFGKNIMIFGAAMNYW